MAIQTRRRLSTLTPFTAPAAALNPYEFFTSTEGVETSEDFKKMILTKASKRVVEVPMTQIGGAYLVRPVNDDEIAAELPEAHVWQTADDLLVRLAGLIKAQLAGEAGELKNDCSENWFKLQVDSESLIVFVYWYAINQTWCCRAMRSDNNRWGPGNRVFSVNLTLTSAL